MAETNPFQRWHLASYSQHFWRLNTARVRSSRFMTNPMGFNHSTREACEALRISDRTLLRLRRDGVLKPGDHFRAAGAGLQRPSLLWNVSEVERALERRSRRCLY